MTSGEILGYFQNGEFRGFGGRAPDCGRAPGSSPGAAGSGGVKGAEPLCFVIAVNRRF